MTLASSPVQADMHAAIAHEPSRPILRHREPRKHSRGSPTVARTRCCCVAPHGIAHGGWPANSAWRCGYAAARPRADTRPHTILCQVNRFLDRALMDWRGTPLAALKAPPSDWQLAPLPGRSVSPKAGPADDAYARAVIKAPRGCAFCVCHHGSVCGVMRTSAQLVQRGHTASSEARDGSKSSD